MTKGSTHTAIVCVSVCVCTRYWSTEMTRQVHTLQQQHRARSWHRAKEDESIFSLWTRGTLDYDDAEHPIHRLIIAMLLTLYILTGRQNKAKKQKEIHCKHGTKADLRFSAVSGNMEAVKWTHQKVTGRGANLNLSNFPTTPQMLFEAF